MVSIPRSIQPGYVLVIAEKPRAAEKIAKALGKPTKHYINRVPVWIVHKDNEYYVIASAVGHMFTLYTDEKGYPVYKYKWVPRYLVNKDHKHIKHFLDVLSQLAKYAKMYISACDYDIEGSVICYMIIKNFGDEKKALRAKFSSLIPQEILRSFKDLSKLDYEMIEAGICRHILDWLWGINISRALMDIYAQASKSFKVLSAGRVQTPTLAYAIDLITQRRLHIPKPLAIVSITIRIGNKTYHPEPLDPPFRSASEARDYLDKIRSDPRAYVENIFTKTVEYEPPHPFNLPDLQAEAYRILHISPYRTQKLAEDLYLEALISYPRTNSQKLPPNLNHKHILEKIASDPTYKPLVRDLLAETRGFLKPNNGPKDDPAHPAIHPTGEGEIKKLSKTHLRLYDLIVRRYLATLSSPAKVQYSEVILYIHGRRYALKGARVLEKGWLKYYSYLRVSEQYIPINTLSRGSQIPIESAKIVTRYTQPPKLPTRLTLLKWMEEVGIGTEATRAEIIETLFKRGYIYSKSSYIDVSDLAIALVSILRDYVKELVSVDLTRGFEKMLSDIIVKKTSCRVIEEKAKAIIDMHIKSMKKNMNRIVQDLSRYLSGEIVVNNLRVPQCRICKRIVYRDNLCVFHYEALNKIRETYSDWEKFEYTWDKYLEKLSGLRITGTYVKEVCRYLLSTESKLDSDNQSSLRP